MTTSRRTIRAGHITALIAFSIAIACYALAMMTAANVFFFIGCTIECVG